MIEPTISAASITGLATIVAAYFGGKLGSRRELNGTAVAVREMRSEVKDVREAQEEHIAQVSEAFKEARLHRAELHDRVATSEGYLEALMEQGIAVKRIERSKRGKKRPTRKRSPKKGTE